MITVSQRVLPTRTDARRNPSRTKPIPSYDLIAGRFQE